MSNNTANLVVQKYGGASLSDTDKIKKAAERIARLRKTGTSVVVVVSAMGKTTNQLLDLSSKITSHPIRRELDMLLTTGERISMALMSMAINALGVPAVSFTGSQAGILTNDSHFDAEIIDVRPHRVQEALSQGKVVVLAGFQGVSPQTKEITTLGRGGTDTSAVAMAAALGASRCEILKDVAAVYTADPFLVSQAKAIENLNYAELEHMSFWGAKVLNYRSIQLAKSKGVSLYVGPASEEGAPGTLVTHAPRKTKGAIGINTHSKVVQVHLKKGASLEDFREFLNKRETPFPQVLLSSGLEYFFTGSDETIELIKRDLDECSVTDIVKKDLSSVTITVSGSFSGELNHESLQKLKTQIICEKSETLGQSWIVPEKQRMDWVQSLHKVYFEET